MASTPALTDCTNTPSSSAHQKLRPLLAAPFSPPTPSTVAFSPAVSSLSPPSPPPPSPPTPTDAAAPAAAAPLLQGAHAESDASVTTGSAHDAGGRQLDGAFAACSPPSACEQSVAAPSPQSLSVQSDTVSLARAASSGASGGSSIPNVTSSEIEVSLTPTHHTTSTPSQTAVSQCLTDSPGSNVNLPAEDRRSVSEDTTSRETSCASPSQHTASSSVKRPSPPANAAASLKAWNGPTRPVSPRLRLAKAAALRAAIAHAVPPAPRQLSKKKKATLPWPGPISTVPHSPRLHTAPKMRVVVAAPVAPPPKAPMAAQSFAPTVPRSPRLSHSTRPRATSSTENAAPPKNPQTKRAPGPTVPRSPRLRCSSKPLSASAAQRKASLDAEATAAAAAARAEEARTRERRAAWASSRTNPKSPAVLRRVPRTKTLPPVRRRFEPTPMPDFSQESPEIRMTAKSKARAASRRSVQPVGAARYSPRLSMPAGNAAAAPRPASARKPMERTVPCPFELRGLEQHEIVLDRMRRAAEWEERAHRLSRVRKPTVLREEILDGPTFVATRSAVPLTQPVDLLPHAQERSQRTAAFQAAQQRRVEELERMAAEAMEERAERVVEELRRERKLRKFKPRPIPSSHYKPDIEPVGSVSDSVYAIEDEGGWTPRSVVQSVTQEEDLPALSMASPPMASSSMASSMTSSKTMLPLVDSPEALAVDAREGARKKRSSILEGLRRSLSPLLGPVENEETADVIGQCAD